MRNKSKEIERLYDQYSNAIFHTAYRILGNVAEAEDIMQNSFIKLYKFEEPVANPYGWLKSVCVREAIDLLRRREKREIIAGNITAERDSFDYIESDDEYIESKEGNEFEKIDSVQNISPNKMIGLIKECLLLLPPKYRTILSLSLFEGYDYQEIAQILDITESGVRSQFKRGKDRLLTELNKRNIYK